MSQPTITPIPQLSDWAATLRAVATAPLEFAPDFPQMAARHEAFWRRENDRPVFLGSANKNPARPITRRLDLLDQPEAWLDARLLDLAQTHRVGDTFPTVRVDFGPVILGALLGGETVFESDTSWTHAFIDDVWANAPDWTLDKAGPLWHHLLTLARLATAHAKDRYVVMLPNLGATGDILLNLRGSSALAMDVLDQPEQIAAAVDALYAPWWETFVALHEIIIGGGAGVCDYLWLWSSEPHVLTQCDFSALIGPRPFKRFFLPDIMRQARTLGRAIHHLDGPDATRHIKSLLAEDAMTAIQYVPGAGNRALDKLDMLREIQAAGRPLQVLTAFDQVIEMCEALDPAGLCILVDEVPGPAELDALYGRFLALYG